jgi:hypothetical protein
MSAPPLPEVETPRKEHNNGLRKRTPVAQKRTLSDYEDGFITTVGNAQLAKKYGNKAQTFLNRPIDTQSGGPPIGKSTGLSVNTGQDTPLKRRYVLPSPIRDRVKEDATPTGVNTAGSTLEEVSSSAKTKGMKLPVQRAISYFWKVFPFACSLVFAVFDEYLRLTIWPKGPAGVLCKFLVLPIPVLLAFVGFSCTLLFILFKSALLVIKQ